MMPEGLTMGILVAAALLDSINPCVFGVLIFLCAFMFKVFKSPNKMLLGGLLYTSVVYLTYFLIGLGFLKFTVSFGFSTAVYWVAAIIAIGAGLLDSRCCKTYQNVYEEN
jgi:ABC-type sugar transport system permease subunit